MTIELLDQNGNLIRRGVINEKNKVIWNKKPNWFKRLIIKINNWILGGEVY